MWLRAKLLGVEPRVTVVVGVLVAVFAPTAGGGGVVGASVLGSAVIGATVVGAAVVGAVVGAAVVGSRVEQGATVEKAAALSTVATQRALTPVPASSPHCCPG